MNQDNYIKELLEIWGSLIGPAHHKSSDLRFSIEKSYQCWNDIKYTVIHHGYVMHHLEQYAEFTNYKDAENYLIKILRDGIEQEIQLYLDYIEDVDNPADISKERAGEIQGVYLAVNKKYLPQNQKYGK